MSQLLKSSSAMGLATLLSRLLGLVREQVYAYFMGTTAVAGAFKLAFQIPNLFRRLLGEGALTAAFVPLFKHKEQTEGEAGMWRTANAVMSGLVVVASAVIAVVMLGITVLLLMSRVQFSQDGIEVFPPWPIPILSPDTRLMFQLLRLMFPYMLLVCLAAMCMGMLNARGHFFIPAMGATTLNLVMIASVLFLAPRFGEKLETQIFALAIGVLVAGVAQFAFQLPILFREGFRFRWVSPWRNEDVRLVVRKMIPGTIGVATFQLNVLVVSGISYWVDGAIVASFDTAVRLMEFPQGVVGISLATTLLTTLSGLAAGKRYPEFRATLIEGLGYLIFVNLLAAVLLVTLAEPIVRLLFERGAFDRVSTRDVGLAVMTLAPGLVAFSVVNILARAFFALGDTKTPMRVSVACLLINVVISVSLVGTFRQAGLGAANTITSLINVWLLSRALRKKLSKLDYSPLKPVLWSALGAAVLAGLVAWLARVGWTQHFGHATLPTRLGEVFVPLGLAAAVYLGVTGWLGLSQARSFYQLAWKVIRRGGTPPDRN